MHQTAWYVLTGPPGSGKTSLQHALRDRGYDVVEEAATDVIAAGQARGDDQPWTSSTFLEDIVELQRRRELQCGPHSGVRFFDRSPICTLALARHLGFAVPPLLHSEIARIRREHVYDHRVFFVEELGFIRPTAARRISRAESLRFAVVHRDTYLRAGFQLVDIPRADVCTRVELSRSHVTAWT